MDPKFTVKVYKAEEGGYWAECRELPGCFTQGQTLPEVRRNAREAIALYLGALASRKAGAHSPAHRGRPAAELSFGLSPSEGFCERPCGRFGTGGYQSLSACRLAHPTSVGQPCCSAEGGHP
ncbi:MAG: type II toxin-antitoxin system HicB family antitoxin [Thermoplasmata archaeon]|nr:type II toxin-antitoxin system HicB family antitoxin [Thermoplasmata archaeon]